jgi:hypothetical protein
LFFGFIKILIIGNHLLLLKIEVIIVWWLWSYFSTI